MASRSASGTDIELRDGSAVVIRRVGPGDEPLIASLYDRLSSESRRRRFLVAPEKLSDEDLRYLTDVDDRRHVALLAIDPATGRAVGEARYVRTPGDRESAEVAAMVADDWQRRGVATALLFALMDIARENGLTSWRAIVSADNAPVLTTLERQGARHVSMQDDEVELVIAFPAEGYPERLRAALREAGQRQLRLIGRLARRIAAWAPG